jgi:two-component system KDP operon response regulator KdpE
MRILAVDDENHILRTLRASLGAAGYEVLTRENGAEAIDAIKDEAPDLILLDLGLPDGDGKDVLRQARTFSVTPVIVLSARHDENEKVAALDLGANDYVEKPFAMGELLARIRAVLRDREAQSYGDHAGFVLDLRDRQARKNGDVLKLTRQEYNLLVLLARSGGRARTHEDLLRAVWGAGREKRIEYLRVGVRQLRIKIEDDPANPRLLLTEPGVGYRLAVSAR